MPISSNDLMQVAKSLSEGPDEASWRTSVNRAYYAAYHSLLSVCEVLPASCDEARRIDRVSHGEVIARLTEWKPSGNAACLQKMKMSAGAAVRLVRAARSLRERADYRLSAEVSRDAAKQQVARARQLCAFAIQVQNELDRSAA